VIISVFPHRTDGYPIPAPAPSNTTQYPYTSQVQNAMQDMSNTVRSPC
jgi:hypothetical protein